MKERPLFPIYDILEHWAAFAKDTPEVRPVHHALYYALVQQAKRRSGTQRFVLPYADGMEACNVHSRTTYVAALRDLEKWGFATYTPGANGIKPPIVGIIFCASTEHQLSIYRSSTYAPADTSAGHIIKEVKRLEVDNNEKASLLAEAEKKIAKLEAELLKANANPAPQAVPLPAPRPVMSDDMQARLDALTDTSGELLWSESLLTKPAYFATVLEKLKLPVDLDSEHYRLDALLKAEAKQVSRTISGWESWVANYFTNQKARGPLLTVDATLPTKPTPKNELPQPGKERKGQVLAFAGENDDYVNRTRQSNYQRNWPDATIHIIQPR